jgi:hypothetical protein
LTARRNNLFNSTGRRNGADHAAEISLIWAESHHRQAGRCSKRDIEATGFEDETYFLFYFCPEIRFLTLELRFLWFGQKVIIGKSTDA